MKDKRVLMDGIKRQVVYGLQWSILSKGLTQIFSWVSTFMVLRMLTPDDYGLVAIAMVFLSLITIFTTNGLVLALVSQQQRNKRDSDVMFTLSIAVNVILSGLLALSAESVALWCGNIKLEEVFVLLAIINPLSSLIVVPMAHLQMEMRFKEKAIAESFSGVISAIVSVTLASNGFGYWSLIYSIVVMVIIRAVALNLYSKSSYGLTIDFSGAKNMIKFAMNIQIGTLVWFIYNRADTILVAKLLGVEQAGLYNVANEVASIPMSKVNALLGEVAFSAFAKTKSDQERSKEYLKKAIKLMGAVVFPVFYGIAIVSENMVPVLMGEQWTDAAVIISILCMVLPFRMLASVMGNYANGMGEAKFNLHNSIFMSIVLVSFIFIGARIGLVQTAMSWVFGYVIVYLFLLIRFSVKFNLKIKDLLIFIPSFLISLLMMVSVAAFDKFVLIELVGDSNVVLLMLKSLFGAIFLFPFLWVLYGKELKNLFL
jgi:teichuronic acid exporter